MSKIQSIFRNHAASYVSSFHLSFEQLKTINDLCACKTSAKGTHILTCSDCGHEKRVHNSCGNRHCPTCGTLDKERWLHNQQLSLLPIHYFHLVFTMPHELNDLIYYNQKLLYPLMYHAVSRTITQLSIKNLKTVPGFSLLLHTWGQTLSFHPHLHCILPGGGLSLDHTHFKSFKKKYFISVKVLSRVFRSKFLEELKAYYALDLLKFFGNARKLSTPMIFQNFLNQLYQKDWVVYAKPVFKCADHVLKYLGNYTHRVAISNYRIKSITDVAITISYKDNKDGGNKKSLTLQPLEFMRRFLLHVLPRKFIKVRHYGFLANSIRSKMIELCRLLIKQQRGIELIYEDKPFNTLQVLENIVGKANLVCPCCGTYYSYQVLKMRLE